ncbi:ABC transporter permease [Pseudochelatococcus sp. G4_1912]|uniref:ABC transporter permease n=1 Tax=Pseudochelatococcus sp. G4_1912 TaxID=3114288 RepID=UPI0039C6E825
MGLITLLYLVFLASPIALLLVGSVGETWTNTLLPHGFTWRWYAELIADPSFRRAFFTSLRVVIVVCVLNVLVGLPLAYAIHAAARRGVKLAARLISLLPVAVPELVLGFGFILVFSSNTLPWLGTFWIVVAGHLVLTLPYTVNALVADMQQSGLPAMEQAAAALGAPFRARFIDIVLPLVATSLTSSLLTVAALSIGEFQLSNLVSGFLSRTYPVVLLQAFYGATGFACAATVVLLSLAVIAALATSMTSRTGFAMQRKV